MDYFDASSKMSKIAPRQNFSSEIYAKAHALRHEPWKDLINGLRKTSDRP